MGPKKGKKGKGNKDEDWGDESEKLMEEKMKKLMTANNDISDDEAPASKIKTNKNKKKNKVKGKIFNPYSKETNYTIKYFLSSFAKLKLKCSMYFRSGQRNK